MFFAIGAVGILRSIGLSHQVTTLRSAVIAMNEKMSKEKQTTSFDVSKVQYYMTNFVYTYINYDKETADERLKQLQAYYAFDIGKQTEQIAETRVLKSQRVISVEEYADYSLALVKIGYAVGDNTYVMNLAIPFMMNHGKLSIVSPPYTLADDLYQGHSEPFEQRQASDLVKLSQDETDSIKAFLQVFFDKYALSDETDLKLIMRKPILMGGNYQVDSLNTSSALFYEGKDGEKVVQLSVVFVDTGTQDKHTEDFTIYLSQSDNGWFVENLYHYFKN